MDRQALIDRLLEHYERPRNYGLPAEADVVVDGGIPDCGDTVQIGMQVDSATETISALRFEGRGCTISQAAASLLAERLEGGPLSAVDDLDDDDVLDLLGREVVRARPRCATLALHTIKVALARYRDQQRSADGRPQP